ncbi:YhcN/YlaJ family sporulation lipoprotein [Paenibacillus eucommiae]|uniref:YhcN/YlaJ family sporulation lipoprotein n=1 Tax=Paenibacillus eucommiae TaxID=1355755 RepID=A0ABS4IZ48_9BACL|nr:YhcN/YlaJ family sporulation lipoprotein [Paenibacillus eucommiae]MBP1992818.1 YhcN/YlaJ family sporulation lipoprotein [Paenibacillus eucommiae]
MKLVCLSLLLVFFAAGCSQNQRNNVPSSPSTQQNGIKVQQIAPQKQEIENKQAVSDRLEMLASSIPQVQSAHCVVLGNTAVIGINVNPEMDRAKVGTVKYAVAEALRKDPDGVNAIVTADMDVDQRLREIKESIQGGRPVSGFAEEMADIIGRIMPQLPRDVQPPGNPATQGANQVGQPGA